MSVDAASMDALSGAILDAAREAGLDAAAVTGLKRLSGGASKESWAFDLQIAGGTCKPLVLRRQPRNMRFSSLGLDRVSAEATIIRLAGPAGVPVPGVAFELPGGSPAGDGYAMDRIEGETVGSRILRRPDLAEARPVMAFRCGEILARLHAMDMKPMSNLPKLGAREALAALDQRHRETGQDRPVFELALRWLDRHLPPERQRALVHGDFRNGNLVVGPEGIRAVLDWELAHIGTPASDLAWLCVTSWRFQNPELPVGGFGTREQLIAGYEAAGGASIDPMELHAWEICQTLNWGVMCAGVAKAFAGGSRSVEGGVIARRASEVEFDLMRLLAPDHEAWNAG